MVNVAGLLHKYNDIHGHVLVSNSKDLPSVIPLGKRCGLIV